MNKTNLAIVRQTLVLACICGLSAAAFGQERKLTLAEAIELAARHNHSLKALAHGVEAEKQKRRIAQSTYFPSISNESNLLHITDLQRVEVPAGVFGALPGGTLIPAGNLFLTQGTKTLESSGTTIAQPITQLIRIHEANKVAEADLSVSKASFRKTSDDITYRVHELYYRVLATQLQQEAAQLQINSGRENLMESTEQVRSGSLLDVSQVESKANLLEAKQALLTTEMQLADLTIQLDETLGLPRNTKLVLDPNVDVVFDLQPREASIASALKDNPEVQQAVATLAKARAAHAAAKTEYIPDVTAFARYSYQNGVPFLERNFGTFGIHLSYDVFDGGKRRSQIRERREEVSAAEENLARIKDEVEVRISLIYNRLETTRAMMEVQKEVLAARKESARLAEDHFNQGIILASQRDASRAQATKAQANLLDASLAYLLARDDLSRALGGNAP